MLPELRIVGRSVNHIPLYTHYFNVEVAEGSQYPSYGKLDVLIFGAFHGDEPESAEICFRFLHEANHNDSFFNGKRVGVLPIVNPDGLLLKTRKNARAVDINRNFETTNWEATDQQEHYHGGPLPFSEPESRAVAQLIQATSPDVILTYHTPYRLINFDGPSPQTERTAGAYAAACDYPCEASIGYPTPGSFGNWAGIERGIQVLTVELPEGEDMEITWPAHHRALSEFFISL
jgi:murein peptide amidase A